MCLCVCVCVCQVCLCVFVDEFICILHFKSVVNVKCYSGLRTSSCIWLKPVAMVLFMLCNVLVEWFHSTTRFYLTHDSTQHDDLNRVEWNRVVECCL